LIVIRQLSELNHDHLTLIAGYTTSAIYVVEKSEAAAQTVISMRLESLATPHSKRFDPPDEEMVARYREAVASGFSFAAYEGEQAVAIALADVQHWNNTLWVWEFHVAPAHQGRGIGRRLMDALAEKGTAAGLRTIVCETQSANVPAIRFYRAVGFQVEGIDLSYYTNEDMDTGREVAIFMKRRLT
jgi:ribosomal protein S18 acetylase RimI-like enzyme